MTTDHTTHRWQDAQGKPASPVKFEQGDGSQPSGVFSVKWPGAKGFHVSRHLFTGGAHVQAVPADHLVVVQPRRVGLMKCRIGDHRLDHRPAEWNVTICPAGMPCEAESDDDADIIMVSLPVDTFAFAAAESAHQTIELDTRLEGRDDRLAALIQVTMQRATPATGSDPLWWDQATDLLVDHLLVHYATKPLDVPSRGLGRQQLRAIRDFVHDNIAEPLTVEMLAAVVGHTRSHFTRRFRLATGLTPHQYVVRTRLGVAHRLLRDGVCTPAQAAADAGFADQSHLSAWTRRMFGATVREMQMSEDNDDRLRDLVSS
jgi:AraC family transcriptional regulator